jgi:hypothetical protein
MALILFIPLFIAAVFLAFYIPGRVVLGESKNISKLGVFAVSIILGFVLWGWQGYIFGFLQQRWLSYLYLLIFLAIFVKKKYFLFKLPKVQLRRIDPIIALIVVIGIFGQLMPFIKTGLISSRGLFIGSYNYCDHIWHAALAQELSTRFPPNEPGLSGVVLSNYNFWFHLVTGEFSRVFHLPLFSVQFSGMYPLASILLAMMGYVFAKSVYDSKLFARIFLFFLFFSGDAIGWLFSMLNGKLMLNISQGLDDAVKFMDTPGYGFSLLIALAAFYLFFKNRQKFSKKTILLIGFLIGSLVGFKTYMGIGFMLGFGLLSLFGLAKKNFSYLWIVIVAGIFSALQFLPFNAKSGGLFFLLLEAPRGFIAQKGLGLSWMDQRWTIYWQHHNYFRLFEYGVFMTAIYLFAQFGIKLLGFIPLKKTLKILGTDFSVLLHSILIPSLMVSMFFYQKVGGGNIWQFLLPVSVVLTIIASLNLSIILANFNKITKITIIVLIIVFTIPTWINFVTYFFHADYLSSFHGIAKAELDQYNFIKNNSPENSTLLLVDQPSYSTCTAASVAKILTQRKLFFSGIGVSGVIFPEIAKREKDIAFIKNSKDSYGVFRSLKNDGINYIVIYNDTPIATNSPLFKNEFLTPAFSNESARILKVD